MAMSKSANTYNRQNWEEAEFPILCQTCLGDNPYIRMTKEKYGKECKTCARPFTVFRWCPGARMRFKKTEVCQTCSKMKNICQTCLLDLEYGLPVQVRDAALKIQDEMPKSDVGKEYYTQLVEKEIANTDGTTAVGALGKAQAPSDMLLKLARTTPYYKRNRPHICSFWVKGECRRGEECPYRHERPTDPDDPLSTQNIKDRFYGINDPVADKLLTRYSSMPTLEKPGDKTITTLYIGNLGDTVSEEDIRNNFYQFGEIRSVSMVARQQCAFLQFTSRASAEAAAEKTFNKLIVNGRRLNVKWGKSTGATGAGATGQTNDPDHSSASRQYKPVPGLPGELPAPPDFFNLSEAASEQPMPPPVLHNLPPPPGSSGGPMGLNPHGPPPPHHMMGPPPPMPPPNMGPMHGPLRFGMRLPPPPPFPIMRPPPGMGYMPLPPRPPPMMPPRMSGIHYPSQDPARMGSAQDNKEGARTSERSGE